MGAAADATPAGRLTAPPLPASATSTAARIPITHIAEQLGRVHVFERGFFACFGWGPTVEWVWISWVLAGEFVFSFDVVSGRLRQG